MKKIAPLLLLVVAIIVGCNKNESAPGSTNTTTPAATNTPAPTPTP